MPFLIASSDISDLIVASPHLHTTANKSYYGVRILTGKQHGAITPRGKYVVLIGSAASSGKVRVIGSFMPSFGGWTEDLIIEADSTLGDILVVEAVNENTILDNEHPWYVSLVTVYNFQSNSSDDFPCYHWIGDEESVSFTARTSECTYTSAIH